ncbi:MAG: BON domain-containing protein [Rhodothermaceae bacterium]|nr:BON domain-containing protein [Rhodothermaceae bacterium]
MKSDAMIKLDVTDELDWEPSVDATHIGVAVEEGVVTLSGTISTYAEKRAAAEAALRVQGVRALADEIEVRLPGAHVRTDTDIARAAANALTWDTLIPEEALDVKVDEGIVTLSGEVPWQYQRAQAADAVSGLTGVQRVVNLIRVKPFVSADNLKEQIEKAFERTAREDARKVEVDVLAGEVTLSGTVNSMAERQEAVRVAWAAPGVTDVHDHLVVRGAILHA